MDKIKEMLKNKKVLTGAAAGLAVVVILIIIIAVSCSKNDNAGKGTSKTTAKEDITTVKKAEKDTANEQNTTEPDTTELSETETSTAEDSTEASTEETTEQPTAEKPTQEPTTTYTEPKTEASTQETINSQPENPVAADPQPQPQPEEPTTTKIVEEPTTVKHYADNGREMSELEWNILNDYWMEDVSHQYSSVYFFEDDEYGKGIQWIDKGSTLGPYVFESDGVYKIIEVFNDTYIIDTDTTVTIIYSDGSFKEILKPSSVLSSKNNEWLNALPSGSGICKYGLEY